MYTLACAEAWCSPGITSDFLKTLLAAVVTIRRLAATSLTPTRSTYAPILLDECLLKGAGFVALVKSYLSRPCGRTPRSRCNVIKPMVQFQIIEMQFHCCLLRRLSGHPPPTRTLPYWHWSLLEDCRRFSPLSRRLHPVPNIACMPSVTAIEQTSQDIRKRVKGGHQLTYAEHTHLERGANVRMPNGGMRI